jgi:peptidyl-prolyl cis-trans isomerase B (cyclophilin B)
MVSCEAPKLEDIDFSEVSLDKVTEINRKSNYVVISVKDYGKIVVRLFPKVAPETVKNFKNLVADKFYDGLIFHRVIRGFMIQGGDPEGTGYGSGPNSIFGEFSKNGFENNLPHLRGVISMARGNDMNSASCQFFICHATYPTLDGKYASFGFVVAGMEVVDRIASTPTGYKDRPITPVQIEYIRFAKVSK